MNPEISASSKLENIVSECGSNGFVDVLIRSMLIGVCVKIKEKYLTFCMIIDDEASQE